MRRWFILLVAAVVAGLSLGCGDNAKDKGKHSGLDKPLPSQRAR